jgi:lipopolysaccharide biosynthesis protein
MTHQSLRLQREERKRLEAIQTAIEKMRNHPHVPADFNWKEYVKINPQLEKKCVDELTALRHWIKSGHRSGLMYQKDVFFDTPKKEKAKAIVENEIKFEEIFFEHEGLIEKTAFLIHVWYFDVFEKNIEPKLLAYKDTATFFFNFVKSNVDESLVERIQKTYPKSTILYSENPGRDIRGYFNMLNYIYQENLNFDNYVFLHTKNQHLGQEAVRCLKSVLRDTVQYPQTFETLLALLDSNQKLGMISSHEMIREGFWTEEEEIKTYHILNHFGFNPSKVTFFEGTMFIVKAKIIDKFLRIPKNLQFFTDMFYENGVKHSGWHHAWERVFPSLVIADGYEILGSNVGHTKEYQKLLPIKENKKAVLLHLYYTETWVTIEPYLKSVDKDTDLFINIVEDNYNSIIEKQIKKSFPKAKILISSNRGRDWGGYYRLSKIVDLSKYDVCFLIHSKRSIRKNKPTGDKWRNEMLSLLLEDKKTFIQTVNYIKGGAHIVSSLKYVKNDPKEIGSNKPWIKELSKRLGIHYDGSHVSFSAGSIFAIKGEIISNIFSAINMDDFEKEEKLDGLLPHALERFVFLYSESLHRKNKNLFI